MAQFSEFERAYRPFTNNPGIPDRVHVAGTPGLSVELRHLDESMLFFVVSAGVGGVAHVSKCAPLPGAPLTGMPIPQGTQFEDDYVSQTPREIWDLARAHFSAAWRPRSAGR